MTPFFFRVFFDDISSILFLPGSSIPYPVDEFKCISCTLVYLQSTYTTPGMVYHILCKQNNLDFKDVFVENSRHYYVHGKDNIPFHTIILRRFNFGFKNYTRNIIRFSETIFNLFNF